MRLPISAIKHVLLTWLVVSLLSTGAVWAQSIKVTGKVTDAKTGESIPGVNVIIKGSTTGTSTDIDGNFTLNAPKGSTLTLSFVGYKPSDAIVSSANMDIKLEPATEHIEEVVVIGYGTVKKSDATGSVQAITSKEFNKGAHVNPEQLIQGRTPGVVITSNSGAPGSASTVRIRGGSSISASNDPLYVIDGVAVDNNSIAGMANPMSSINPNDIESISILKDASATAIYGARASNGVIIITTKKGSSNFKVSYNGKAMINTVTKNTGVYSADEFTKMVTDYFGNPNLPTYNANAIKLLGTSNTSWQNQIFRVGVGTDQNISVGGSVRAGFPYRVSLGYTKENGTIKTSEFNRTTAAVSLTPSFLNNTLSFNLNVKGVYTKNRFSNGGAIGNAVYFDPTKPVYSDDAAYSSYGGYYTWLQSSGIPNKIAASNPVALLNQTDDVANVYRSIGNLQVDYKFPFAPGLKASVNMGYDYSKSDGTMVQPENAAFTFNTFGDKTSSGYYKEYGERRRSQLLDVLLNYNKTFDNSALTALDITGGYSWQHFWRSGNTFSRDAQSNTESEYNSHYISENYLVSFFGRSQLTLLQNFILTGTVRYDGSSRFTGGNRWGLFPSGALAWKINGMEFLKDETWINELKLRVGYGITGQQDILGSDYPTLGIYSYGINGALVQFGYDAQGKPYFTNVLRPGPYNDKLKWEEAVTTNIGIDFGFLGNRITGTFDAYYKETKNLINYVPIPAGTNFSNQVWANVGNMNNRGFEFSVTGKPVVQDDLSLDVTYNMSYNKSEITKLLQNSDPSYAGVPTGGIGGGTGSTVQINSIGYPRNTYYVYQQIYDNNGKPIEGAFVDQNKDGVINQDDLIHYKQADPKWTFGISAALNYKSWDFGFGGRASVGNYVYNNVASGASYQGFFNSSGYLSNQPKFLSDFGFNQVTEKTRLSSYFVQNASFFKMDYLTLGYRFNNIFKSKVNARLSGAVQNVFTITPYKGIDPEYSNGIDNNIYPRPRTYIVNLSLDF